MTKFAAKGPPKERIDGLCLGQTLIVHIAIVSPNVGPVLHLVCIHEVVSAWAIDQKGEQGPRAD